MLKGLISEKEDQNYEKWNGKKYVSINNWIYKLSKNKKNRDRIMDTESVLMAAIWEGVVGE